MARGFINGILAGSLLGAVALMFMSPQKKQVMSSRVLGKTKKMQARAEEMVSQVSDGVKDLRDILKS